MANESAVTTLAICKWLREQVSRWEADAKRELNMRAGAREPAMINGIEVGTVTMTRPSRTVIVKDEDALLAWVQDNVPTEVETVQRIRPAYRTKLLDQVKNLGALVDADGVVYDGIVEVSLGEPHSMVKNSEEAGIVISGMLSAGRITTASLKAIGGHDE